jgi:hypothetical protein
LVRLLRSVHTWSAHAHTRVWACVQRCIHGCSTSLTRHDARRLASKKNGVSLAFGCADALRCRPCRTDRDVSSAHQGPPRRIGRASTSPANPWTRPKSSPEPWGSAATSTSTYCYSASGLSATTGTGPDGGPGESHRNGGLTRPTESVKSPGLTSRSRRRLPEPNDKTPRARPGKDEPSDPIASRWPSGLRNQSTGVALTRAPKGVLEVLMTRTSEVCP